MICGRRDWLLGVCRLRTSASARFAGVLGRALDGDSGLKRSGYSEREVLGGAGEVVRALDLQVEVDRAHGWWYEQVLMTAPGQEPRKPGVLDSPRGIPRANGVGGVGDRAAGTRAPLVRGMVLCWQKV